MAFNHLSNVGIGSQNPLTPQQALSLGVGMALGIEMAPPAAGGTAVGTTGGTLSPSTTYYYKYTYLDYSATGETLPGAEFSVTLTGAQNAVTLTPVSNPLTAAGGTKWYRGTVAGAENVYVGYVASNYGSITDTGTLTAGSPPTVCTAYANLIGANTGNALFVNAAGGLINVNNLNTTGGFNFSQRIGLFYDSGTSALTVQASGRAFGVRTTSSASSGTDLFITGGTVGIGLGITTPSGQLHIRTRAVGTPTLYLQNLASQTANALELWDSTGATRLATLSTTGAATFSALNVSGAFSLTNNFVATTAAIFKASSGQTADIIQTRDNASNVNAKITNGGGLTNYGYHVVTALVTPSAPTITNAGTAGTTTYYYRVTAVSGTGETGSSADAVTTTGNATLSATNYNVVTIVPTPGAESYNIYRSPLGGQEKLIGNSVALVYNDQNPAAGTTSLPSSNTTGYLTVGGFGNFGGTVNWGPGGSIGTLSGPGGVFKLSGYNAFQWFQQNTSNNVFDVHGNAGTGDLLNLYPTSATTTSVLRATNGGGLTNSGYHTIAALTTPVAPTFTTATTGGTLAPGTYYYRITAVSGTGETLASTEASQVVPAGTSTNTVTLTWAAVSGAETYKVYGRTTGAELLIASAVSVLTYTDTGSITPAGALPTGNTTGYLTLTGQINTSTIIATSKIQTSTYINTQGLIIGQQTKTGAYTLTVTDFLVLANGTFPVTFPDVVANAHRVLGVMNTGTGAITNTPQAGQTFNGASTFVMSQQNQCCFFQSDGVSDWKLISNTPLRLRSFSAFLIATPATGADVEEFVMPYDNNGNSLTFSLNQFTVRANVVSSSSSTIKLETSTGTGAFSVASTSQTFTLAASSNETVTSGAGITTAVTVTSGQKVRFNWVTVGASLNNVHVEHTWAF